MVTVGSLDLKQMDKYLYTSVGIGARYRTPVGPVRLDLGFRLPVGLPQVIRQDDPRALTYAHGGCFGIGSTPGKTGYAGDPEGLCAFHLSIGEAF